MKIKTEVLQKLVAKAVKGASNNKMIPITGFMGIEIENGNMLVLTTTDGNNIFKVKGMLEEQLDDFYTIVSSEAFSKLIGKLTKEFVELTLQDNFLVVNGNGKYKLEIPLDSEGNIVKFEDIPALNELTEKECEIDANKLKVHLETASQSIAETMEIPIFQGYYIGKSIISTDSEKLCYIKDDLGVKNPMLLSSVTAELLTLFEGKIDFYRRENELLFISNDTILYCKELVGKENYPVETVSSLLDVQFQNSIKVSKDELLNALDRMDLFVDDFDKNGVYLAIENSKLILTSQKSSATEELNVELGNTGATTEAFSCLVDIKMLIAEVKAVITDMLEIYYGNSSSLQIKDGNTILMISLMDEET